MPSTKPATPKLELFHALADPASAAARRAVVELGLAERVRFRNVAFEEVAADLAARGGARTPALWDGVALVEGAETVCAALAVIAGTPRGGGG